MKLSLPSLRVGAALLLALFALATAGALLFTYPPEPLSLFVQGQLAERFLPGPPQKDLPLDREARVAVINAMTATLNAHYVDAEKAKELERSLNERLARGEFDHVEGARLFSFMLTNHLQAHSGDRHLGVRYSEQFVPDPPPDGKPSPQEREAELAENRRLNYGVSRVERLGFNIGYLELQSFPSAAEVADRYAAAMTLVKDTRALIIDLRRNHGGEPSGVALFASYLFDHRTRLTDIFFRDTDKIEETWTVEELAGPRYGAERPVYVLTSDETFSGGDLAYTLQALKRATIIGEATRGGAQPGDMRKLTDHFSMFVPNGSAINSITHSNWEGTGVVPDDKRRAGNALSRAQVLALEKRLESERDEETRGRIRSAINDLR
jgi:hypothetical protein